MSLNTWSQASKATSSAKGQAGDGRAQDAKILFGSDQNGED